MPSALSKAVLWAAIAIVLPAALISASISAVLQARNVVAARHMTVYTSPLCGCCIEWIDYMKTTRFQVEVVFRSDMAAVRHEYNIPDDVASCHTAVIGRYFVEGHMPAEAIDKLLLEKPDIDGIALAGMPAGSPGMPGPKEAPFVIVALSRSEQSIFMID